MNTTALQGLQPGFRNEALDSQAVFRTGLTAMSHPGRPVAMPDDIAHPKTGHAAAAALLLALLDSDCHVWLSPTLAAGDAGHWLRFHTGCQLVSDATQAQFLWVGLGDALPDFSQLRSGSDAYPDQSATCVLEVAELRANVKAADAANAPWHLSGPGIPGQASLASDGLTPAFATQWADNHAQFPRGVDAYLATHTHVVGLPRTTAIRQAMEI